MVSSLKTNVVLNFVNTITGIIFPVITFPYAARVLMPDGIGAVNFLLAIVNYIVLLTSLGIPMYAVREIAKFRDDIDQRNKITVEITLLSVSLCLFGYVIVWILGEFVPQIHTLVNLFYILSLVILFTGIGVQWFYQGIEDFKFITIRALIIRTLAALSLFLFVKDKSDLLIYGLVVVGSTVGNNVINFVHLRKFISLSVIKWRELRILRHLKPALRIFILNLIISLYINLNSVMLGFIQGDESVGLYTAGIKMSHVILSLVTSLGVVMLPRCSNLVQTGRIDEFATIGNKSMRLVMGLALPLTIGLMLLAQPIIHIFCGTDFTKSVSVLYWTAPIILFVGITNVIGIQILYPQNQEKIVIWSTIGGAVINLLLNIPLIPLYAQNGAAISTFAAELIVLVIQIILGRKYIPFKLLDIKLLPYLVATLLMVCVIGVIQTFIHAEWGVIIASLLIGTLTYVGSLLYFRDELVLEMMGYIFRRKRIL